MTRTLMISNLLLALVVALQAWWLHAAATDSSATGRLQAANAGDVGLPATQDAAGASSSPGIDVHVLSMQLARIEQRLASLEPSASPGQGSVASAPTQASGPAMSTADADRRLAELLPVTVVGRTDLELYRARLSALSQAEQAAVEAALSRAINQDRIRLRL